MSAALEHAGTGSHRPRRVLHVTAPARFGGLERVVLNLTAGQRARGIDASVVTLVHRDADPPLLVDELRAAGIAVFPLLTAHRAYGAQLRALRRQIGILTPEIVHSHGYHLDVVIALLKRWLNTPTVSTVHGFTGGDRKARLYEYLQLRAHRSFDAIIAVSSGIAERLKGAGVPAHRIHVLPNAAAPRSREVSREDARAAVGVPHDALSIGWVGRVSREKGLDVLVDALPALVDLPIRLSVMGDGPERLAVREQSRALGVEDRISWLGVVPNAEALLHAFDLVVLSSRTEGSPITLLEAMQAGVPVVATSVGGVPDITSEREARLIPPERPDLLAKAIRQALLDSAATSDRARMAKSRVAQQFTMDAWLDAHDQIYAGITASRTVAE